MEAIISTDALGLNLFDYDDHREFLSDYYTERKKKERKFSHRFLQQKVGASSSGWFSDILKGRQTLSDALLFQLTEILGLNNREREHFAILVRYQQAASIREKRFYFRRLSDFREVKAGLLTQEQFEFFSQWYHPYSRDLAQHFFELATGKVHEMCPNYYFV